MPARSLLSSSLIKKQVVALSALALGLFIIIHMLGNMLLFFGPEAYNSYSYKLTSSPFISVIEIGLLTTFLVHIGLTLFIAYDNRKKRGAHKRTFILENNDKLGSWTSRNMVYTGLLVLLFVILHLIQFRFGPVYTTSYHSIDMRDIYKLVVEYFSDPLYVIFYEISLIVLGLHLHHGIKGLFQTLGFQSVLSKKIILFSYIVGSLLIAGFMSQPLYLYFLPRST